MKLIWLSQHPIVSCAQRKLNMSKTGPTQTTCARIMSSWWRSDTWNESTLNCIRSCVMESVQMPVKVRCNQYLCHQRESSTLLWLLIRSFCQITGFKSDCSLWITCVHCQQSIYSHRLMMAWDWELWEVMANNSENDPDESGAEFFFYLLKNVVQHTHLIS